MKVCFKCNKEKPLTEYYKHPMTKDGHLNKCKDCTKKDSKTREHHLRKDETWVALERDRHREKYHRLGYKGKHYPTKEARRERQLRYRELYPEKYKAKSKTSKMKRKEGHHLHHWSYNEEHYKDVIELSMKDHNTIHRHIIYDQERKMYRVAIEFGLWAVGTLLDTRERSENYYNGVLFSGFCDDNN